MSETASFNPFDLKRAARLAQLDDEYGSLNFEELVIVLKDLIETRGEAEKRERFIKSLIQPYMITRDAAELPVCDGQLIVTCREQKGRSYIDSNLLFELGVSTKTIKDATKQGNPYYVIEIKSAK